MKFQIEVIQVIEETDKTNNRGGKYNAINLVYKKDGKVEPKSFPDWSNKEIYEALKALKQGDLKTITTEKVNGFWKWLKLESFQRKDDLEDVTEGTVTEAVSNSSYKPGKVIGSNYETKEERAARQILIVRQSCLSTSVALFAAAYPKGFDISSMQVDEIRNVASKFEEHVFKKD